MTGDSLQDPAKLVADDLIIVAKTERDLQTLLETCTEWTQANSLEWKPHKCAVIAQRTSTRDAVQFKLARQPIPLQEQNRYLGVLITHKGFTERAEQELEGKCVSP